MESEGQRLAPNWLGFGLISQSVFGCLWECSCSVNEGKTKDLTRQYRHGMKYLSITRKLRKNKCFLTINLLNKIILINYTLF